MSSSDHIDAPKFTVEEVDSVAAPPRAKVEQAEAPADKLERKRDYLAGFLEEKPVSADPTAPGGDLYEDVIAALKDIFDPEIPVNIYDLGLIYGVDVAEDGGVVVSMTLTRRIARWPNRCPARLSCGSAQCPACAMPR